MHHQPGPGRGCGRRMVWGRGRSRFAGGAVFVAAAGGLRAWWWSDTFVMASRKNLRWISLFLAEMRPLAVRMMPNVRLPLLPSMTCCDVE